MKSEIIRGKAALRQEVDRRGSEVKFWTFVETRRPAAWAKASESFAVDGRVAGRLADCAWVARAEAVGVALGLCAHSAEHDLLLFRSRPRGRARRRRAHLGGAPSPGRYPPRWRVP